MGEVSASKLDPAPAEDQARDWLRANPLFVPLVAVIVGAGVVVLCVLFAVGNL